MNIKKFGIAFGIILLYIGLSNAESIIFYFIKTGSNLIDNIYLLLMSTINLVIMLVITRRHWKDEWQKFRENKKKMMPASLKYWLIGFAFMFVTNLLINFFLLRDIAPNEANNRELLNSYKYYSLITTALIAPIIEEIIFRLNFKDVFKNKNMFIIFTGVLFGALHLMSSTSLIELVFIIPYSCLGIAFSKIYAETENVFPSIIMHILHNSFTLLIILGGL